MSLRQRGYGIRADSARDMDQGRLRAHRFRDQFVSAYERAAGGVRMSPFRAETRTRISVARRPRVFGAVGTGEDFAATGRIRELFLGGRTGPATVRDRLHSVTPRLTCSNRL
jgi:hypothetical protein